MPTPTIPDGKLFFNAVTWTGNGTSSGRSITGVGFQPNFVWGKARSVAYGHGLYDVARGTGKLLVSNNTNAEATNFLYGYLSSFDSNGFTTTAGSSSNENWNQTNDTYVAWNWKAGGAAVANTSGSIASQVSVNANSGFSVVTYTSPNNVSDQTVGHGLGVKPSMIIVKNRDNTYNWDIYHSSLGYNSSLIFTTSTTRSGAFGAEPDNLVFTTKNTYTHNSTDKYVAYCWAPIAGYSAFGSYTGNGSADGSFVYTGFRPRYIMVKCSSDVASWWVYDSSRNTYNAVDLGLIPNATNADTSGYPLDFLSNGFKFRNSNGDFNGSGRTYIYMAFAENPFKYANAR